MTSYLRGELSAMIRDEEFWQSMQFSDIGVEGLSDFFYFHDSSEDQMSHLNEIINKDKNIMISYTHKDADQKRTYIVHKDVTLSAFRNRQRV